MSPIRQRAGAVLVVLALLLSMPVPALQRCTQCPPHCPMHAGKLHCHGGATPQAAATPAGPCVHGAACGHVAPQLPVATPAVLTPRAVIAWNPVITTPAAAEPRVLAQSDPEPATGPPRA